MRAAVLHNYGQPMKVEEVEIDDPKPTEVKVKIAASGVCHSDYAFILGEQYWEGGMPMILGHEGAGIVEKAGSAVTTVKPGDHVVLSWIYACGNCYYCTVGKSNMCDVGRGEMVTGNTLADGTNRYHKDGKLYYHFLGISTMAEYTICDEKSVVKIDKDIPLDKAALVGCAVMTGVGAVINTAKPAAGESLAVFGSGGVGISCIQGAVLSGAYPIIAVDVKQNKLELAKQFGATHTVDASKVNAVEEIQKITGGGANYTFEAVGQPQLMRDSWDALAKCGTAVVIGGAKMGDEVSIPALDFPFTEKTIRGTGYGSARMNVDIPKLLDLYRGDKLNLDDMVTSTYPLDAVNEAFADLHAGKNLRGVLMM